MARKESWLRSAHSNSAEPLKIREQLLQSAGVEQRWVTRGEDGQRKTVIARFAVNQRLLENPAQPRRWKVVELHSADELGQRLGGPGQRLIGILFRPARLSCLPVVGAHG